MIDSRTLAARILGLLDLTRLGEDNTPGAIRAPRKSARTPYDLPVAVCVYPDHGTTARAGRCGFEAVGGERWMRRRPMSRWPRRASVPTGSRRRTSASLPARCWAR